MGWNGTIFRKYITDENCSIEHKTEKKIPQMVYSVPPENGTTLTLAFHKKKTKNNKKSPESPIEVASVPYGRIHSREHDDTCQY